MGHYHSFSVFAHQISQLLLVFEIDHMIDWMYSDPPQAGSLDRGNERVPKNFDAPLLARSAANAPESLAGWKTRP